MALETAGRAVLITGASTGIGAASACVLAGAGCRVFAGVRRAEDGERLAARAPGGVEPIILDVTDAGQIAAAREAVEAALGDAPLHGLVNNAGIAVSGPLEFLPLDRFRQQMEVNLTGQLAVTQAFLPLIRRGTGRIVFIGSTSGVLSTPFLGAYCASKFAIEGLVDALRGELRAWHIEVSVIQPGPIETAIWERSEEAATQILDGLPAEGYTLYGYAFEGLRKASHEVQRRAIPAERVGELVRHALFAKRPKTRYLIGKGGRLECVLARWVPDRLRDAILCRILGL